MAPSNPVVNSMDARRLCVTLGLICAFAINAQAQVISVGPAVSARRFVVESQHFRVFATDPALAQEVAQMADQYRRHLAMHWLGRELPPWQDKVPVVVQSTPTMPASGETKYTLVAGTIREFNMVLCGSRERILDSVLPHEMTHTILATHFAPSGKPIPRWADEGACTTVEHVSERSKHDVMLVKFLSEGRGIPFASLFAMRDYPKDLMPLYAQGYSVCAFLIAQGGPRQFVRFLERGMHDENWVAAVSESYGYPKIGDLKVAWNQWVSDGGGQVNNYTAVAMGYVKDPTTSMVAVATPLPSPTSNVVLASAAPSSQDVLPAPLASTTGKGFYQDQFQKHGMQVQASQPGPLQTVGGTLYR